MPYFQFSHMYAPISPSVLHRYMIDVKKVPYTITTTVDYRLNKPGPAQVGAIYKAQK